MGEISEYHREQIEDQRDRIKAEIYDMDDRELVETVQTVIDDINYRENDFTEMTRSISEKFERYGNLSDAQRKVLRNHLLFNSQLWWEDY